MALKLTFVTLLILGLALPAVAAPKAIVFGLKGGIDYSNLDYSHDAYESDYLLGYGGGITLGTPASPAFGIDLDILFLRKGAKKEYRNGSSPESEIITFETKLDYIVVSPLVRFSPGRGGAGIYMLAGPEFGYLLDATSTSSSSGSPDIDHDLSDSYKDLDMGVSFGMGFQSSQDRGPSFFVESRYALGLTNLADEDESSPSGGSPEVKTRGIYVFGGLRF